MFDESAFYPHVFSSVLLGRLSEFPTIVKRLSVGPSLKADRDVKYYIPSAGLLGEISRKKLPCFMFQS